MSRYDTFLRSYSAYPWAERPFGLIMICTKPFDTFSVNTNSTADRAPTTTTQRAEIMPINLEKDAAYAREWINAILKRIEIKRI